MPIHASLILLQSGASSSLGLIAFQLFAIIAIFYFLLIRPQKKERERHEEMITALKKGDEVVTTGGVIGTIVHAEEDRLTIRSGDNTRLLVQRARIAQRIEQESEPRAKGGAR